MLESRNQEETLFAGALELPTPEGRAAYLKEACGNDAELRRRVEELLEAYQRHGSLFDADPAVRLMGAGASDRSTRRLGEELTPGRLVDRYRLLERVGEGRLGVVFLAEQSEPVRVALKVIDCKVDSRAVLARFAVERPVLTMMNHPNIGKVFDAGATDPRSQIANNKPLPFFIMEWVSGLPLTTYCQENELSIPARLDVFVQVCQAVQHAHQIGLLHGNIKPSNVLVTVEERRPKVIEFGIARAVGARLDNPQPRLEGLVSAAIYGSPEQMDLSALDVDVRSEIYSLGASLYELLTGEPPFDPAELTALGPEKLRRRVLSDLPPLPSTRLGASGTGRATSSLSAHDIRQPKIPSDLDWIVMKALAKDPTRRYQSVAALAEDISRHLRHEPVRAAPSSLVYQLRRFLRRIGK